MKILYALTFAVSCLQPPNMWPNFHFCQDPELEDHDETPIYFPLPTDYTKTPENICGLIKMPYTLNELREIYEMERLFDDSFELVQTRSADGEQIE